MEDQYCQGDSCQSSMAAGGGGQSGGWQVATMVTSSLAVAALLLNLCGRYWWLRRIKPASEDKSTETAEEERSTTTADTEERELIEKETVVALLTTAETQELAAAGEDTVHELLTAAGNFKLSAEDIKLLIRVLGTLDIETLLATLESAVDAEMTTNGNGHGALNGLLMDLVDALRVNVDLHVTKEGFPEQLANNLSRIEELENPCNTLHGEFDKLSVAMVSEALEEAEEAPEAQKPGTTNGVSGKDVFSTFQTRRAALRSQWACVRRLFFCVDVHLRNSTGYQQFYYETGELKLQLEDFLNHIKEEANEEPTLAPPSDLKAELKEMESTWDSIKQWDCALGELTERSRKIVPVRKRVDPLSESVVVKALCNYKTDEAVSDKIKLYDSALYSLTGDSRTIVPVRRRVNALTEPLSVRALCNYVTDEVSITDGEQLLLMDNSDISQWKVKKTSGDEEYSVPALILLIPPPDEEALAILAKLRRRLDKIYNATMEMWRNRLMFYIKEILQYMINHKDKFFRSVTKEHKAEIAEIMSALQERIDTEFGDHEDHDVCTELISQLSSIVEQASSSGREYAKFDEEVIQVLLRLVNLFKRYESLHKQYRTFREYCCCTDEEYDTDEEEEWQDLNEAVDVNVTTEERERSTTTYTQSSAEMNQKFTIKSVRNTIDDSEISIDEAIAIGIIDADNGMYNNLKTGERYPIPIAMTAGFIIVESTQTKKSEEKTQGVGVVTVKVTKNTRPYTITQVIDPRNDEVISVDEAEKRGVFSKETGIWSNPSTSEKFAIQDAIDCGGLKVEYGEDDTEAAEADVEIKHFAVFGVLDRRKDKRVPFYEACKQGLIDKEEGTYYDNKDGKTMDVVEAFRLGFVKARTIEDPKQVEFYLSKGLSGSSDSINSN